MIAAGILYLHNMLVANKTLLFEIGVLIFCR